VSHLIKILIFIFLGCSYCFAQDSVRIIIPTFLGNETRNYYGNEAPSKLDIIWKYGLGCGETIIPTKIPDTVQMCGAGWTGQALLVEENGELFLIQGAYDHMLKKINAKTRELVWEYDFGDVIKGTGCIWTNPFKTLNHPDKYVIFQGSRIGIETDEWQKIIPSFKAISYRTGKLLWEYNSVKSGSYSRDVDGTALICDDTLFLGLETGQFVIINPNPDSATVIDKIKQPLQYAKLDLFSKSDISAHNANVVTESSPTLLRDHIYISSGAGHVYGYNRLKGIIDFDFYTGADMDGSPAVTRDSCLLISVEKEYIAGHGGAMLINSTKHQDSCVVWFMPTGDEVFADWKGGIIGSVATNDKYITSDQNSLSAFVGIDGYLYVVENEFIDINMFVPGPDNIKKYYQPQLVFKYETGASISTPIFVGNKLIVLTYFGLYLFEQDKNCNFKLLAEDKNIRGEATPIVHNKRVYIASRDGYLYCLGTK
jgi:outer membrane protein assembly factor BamB